MILLYPATPKTNKTQGTQDVSTCTTRAEKNSARDASPGGPRLLESFARQRTQSDKAHISLLFSSRLYLATP